MDESLEIIIRDFNPETDSGMVYSSWRNGSFYGREQDEEPATFFRKKTKEIKEILRNAAVRVACIKSEPDIIIGYSVFTGTHLDWIFVKINYRRQGIATLLFPKTTETVTSDVTKIGDAIIQKKKLKIKENQNEEEVEL